MLPDRNPLFVCEGSRLALGTILQLEGGSPHSFGSPSWRAFGRELVNLLQVHLLRTKRDRMVRELVSAVKWMKTSDATAFFDKHIPQQDRGKEYIFL